MDKPYTNKGSNPFFPLSDKVIYISRGYRAEKNNTGITFPVWIKALEQIAETIKPRRQDVVWPR